MVTGIARPVMWTLTHPQERSQDEVAGDADLIPLRQQGSNMYSRDAKEVRQMYQEYFTSRYGEVPWQWNYVDSVYNTFDLM